MLSRGERAFQDIDQGCSEVGSRIAVRLGMSEATQLGLYHICETWNGKGPHKLKGADIPLAARIVNVAMILEVVFSERGLASAKEAAEARKGKSFDPDVAAAVIALTEDSTFWETLREQEAWNSVLDLEPRPVRYVEESTLDDIAYALADIVDLKSTTTATHSRRTAEIADMVAKRLRLPEAEITLSRRAGLVHDVGLVAVPALLLERGARWSEADTERFRLHTYYTERILARSDCLRPIGDVGSAHHERTDGAGYHRRLSGNQLSMAARVVAAASAYAEVSEQTGDEAEQVIEALKRRRGLDRDCLEALASGDAVVSRHAPQRRAWPSGLTDREVEVLRLIASGMNLKEAAARLVISDHTARHHLENIYSKAGVSSRAGMTLFAVENGLLA